VPVRDVAALAGAVGRYLADPGLRERHGRAGRARVLADFRPEAIWRSTYETYRRLLTGRVPALDAIASD
jgi:glycosyltransferase involved in cell wall biosynthesis